MMIALVLADVNAVELTAALLLADGDGGTFVDADDGTKDVAVVNMVLFIDEFSDRSPPETADDRRAIADGVCGRTRLPRRRAFRMIRVSEKTTTTSSRPTAPGPVPDET